MWLQFLPHESLSAQAPQARTPWFAGGKPSHYLHIPDVSGTPGTELNLSEVDLQNQHTFASEAGQKPMWKFATIKSLCA